MDITYEDVLREFERQVRLCSVIGGQKMKEVVNKIHPNRDNSIRGQLLSFLKWHDAKFESESSDKIIADIVDEYLNSKSKFDENLMKNNIKK